MASLNWPTLISPSSARIGNLPPMVGFLLIDKPSGPTSHDVVDRIRALIRPPTSPPERPDIAFLSLGRAGNLQPPKVGHAGTLDPFATGLLIVGVGREATREFSKLSGLDKSYETTFVLGATSDTDDRMGRIEGTSDKRQVTREEIETAMEKFVGEIKQVPPAYAAIKVDGKKMYEAARQGKPIAAKPRNVRVDQFTFISSDPTSHLQLPTSIHVHISCSSGTYIRALARDLGRTLGVGAYVEELRRTRIGPFSIQEAVPLSTLKPATFPSHLLPIKTVVSRLLSGGPTSATLGL